MKKSNLILLLCLFSIYGNAQTLSLIDLSAFKPNTANNWKIVGDVSSDISKINDLTTTEGTGILACIHQQGKYGAEYELVSNLEHQDLDIELEFMMAKGSNSGIYLQGNYEVQLMDSWGKKNPKYNDCGGIYERWDDSKPNGEKGYEGTAPRINACKAPGLWQKIKISFQAARFDANGKKLTNAKFLEIVLNGIVIHENVEVSGPSRGSLTVQDVVKGPLRIQGDHGSLAIRNIKIANFDKTAGIISDIKYKIHYGSFKQDADLSKLKIAENGNSDALTWEILKNQNDYVFVQNFNYNAPTDGNYTFKLQMSGHSYLKVDDKEVLNNIWKFTAETREATVELKAGKHAIEIFNNKRDGWMKPILGFWSAGPGFRETPHHAISSLITGKPADPILVEAKTNTNLRSFMDFKKSPEANPKRVVHAISVGSPENLHYSYDLDKAALFQVWQGGFLDTSPMWNDRGDGSSRPTGSVTVLNNDMILAKMTTSETAWPKDTIGSGYRPKGYVLNDNDVPTFQYLAFGSKITDATSITDGKYFTREIKISDPNSALMARLAEGTISKLNDTLFAVNDKSYYIQIESGTIPVVRNSNGKQELLISAASGTVKYSIIF